MAKGNWHCNVIKPATRCRLCGAVIHKAHGPMVYLDGITPAHKSCADVKKRAYTLIFTRKAEHK